MRLPDHEIATTPLRRRSGPTTARPSAGSPAQQTPLATTGCPFTSGAGRAPAAEQELGSQLLGASRVKSR
jgi:hypothetical protein